MAMQTRCPSFTPSRPRAVLRRTTTACCATQHHKGTGMQAGLASLESGFLSACLLLTSASPALADQATNVDFASGGNADPKSYWTALGLFLLSVPGLWSQIKRAPKAKIKRKTFEAAGPAVEGAKSMDQWATTLFTYMKAYNYEVRGTGEVITFAGNYRSTRGQAAAITFYTFMGMLSCGLVFSIALPGGNWWYLLVGLTPLSTLYYYSKADREEEFSIKMAASDDEKTIDIIVQGDDEEIQRMTRELQLREKGMEYVPGLFEGAKETQEAK